MKTSPKTTSQPHSRVRDRNYVCVLWGTAHLDTPRCRSSVVPNVSSATNYYYTSGQHAISVVVVDVSDVVTQTLRRTRLASHFARLLRRIVHAIPYVWWAFRKAITFECERDRERSWFMKCIGIRKSSHTHTHFRAERTFRVNWAQMNYAGSNALSLGPISTIRANVSEL